MAVATLLACVALRARGAPDELTLISLAHRAVVAEVTHRPPPVPDTATQAKPVFVTIEIGGAVRGCRGSLEVESRTIEEGVARAARAASGHDPRYRPLQPAELAAFKVTVTIVDRVERLEGVSGLRPDEGLVLKSGNRTGVVLPYEGRDPRTRLGWAYRKAGVPETASVQLFRLTARRFRG